MRGLDGGLAFVVGRAECLQVFVRVGAALVARSDVIDVAGDLIALIDGAQVVVGEDTSTDALPG